MKVVHAVVIPYSNESFNKTISRFKKAVQRDGVLKEKIGKLRFEKKRKKIKNKDKNKDI